VDPLGAAHGLPYDVTYALLEDREGSLWIGTAGAGAARLRDGSFTVYGVREGLADDFVYPVHEDAAGRTWVGTARGLSRYQDGRWTTLTSRDGLCHDAVRSLWVGPSDELWVGTYGGGACRLTGAQWTRYGSRDGLAHDNVRAVLGTRDGSVWVGTLDGLSRLVGSRWRTYTTADGLPANSVIALHEDRDGGLWIGTDGGGLARHRDGRVEAHVVDRPLPSAVVLALHEDREGTLWIGTGGGLARLREGSLAVFTTREGLPADSVHQILDDGDDLWIGGPRGVYRVSKKSLDDHAAGRAASVAPLVLGRSDGLRSLQCTAPAQPAGFRTRDGRLWFATARGVAVLDPARIRIETSPPPMVVEAVVAEDHVFESPRDLTLGPGLTRLSFQYTGLGLLAPERLNFRHRLVGFDEDWIGAGDRRAAYYTGLPPGEYRFEVAGRSGGGDWSPAPASVRVTLRPRFYQTRAFYFMAVVGVVLLAVAAHRVRVGRLHERQRELARLVEERTHRLREAKELAEAAQRESDDRRRIIEEADAVKTELLGIAVHDLKNPLQSVLTASEILQLSSDRRVAEPARVVHSSALRMFGLVNDLLATAAVEGRIDLRLAPVDVGKTAREVVADYQGSAERKQQHLGLASEEVCLALADGDRTRDIIDNLVSNAVKYTPARGRIEVAVTAPSTAVRIEVRDQGPGLTDADRARLFGRFQRLSARPTGGEPSTGLGLYIVKRLTEAMGGRVWVETDGPGTGSRFVVELPKAG
jgi:signal transduction histidine kinase